MAKARDIIRTIVNVTLGFGTFLVFNENPKTFIPNIIGLSCFGLLIWINREK